MIGQIRNKFGNQLRVVGYIGILAVALIALSVPADAAFAAEPDQEEVERLLTQLNGASPSDAAFARLTPEQQAAVIEALTISTVEVVEEIYDEPASNGYASGAAGASSESCRRHTVNATAKGPWPQRKKLWTYTSRTHWCYDGSVITSTPSFTRGVNTHNSGWEFVRHLSRSQSGGKGGWEHEDYTEGHFRLCKIKDYVVVCKKNSYPDITKWQYGDGDYDSEVNY